MDWFILLFFFSMEEHLHLVAWLGFFQKKTDYSAGN